MSIINFIIDQWDSILIVIGFLTVVGWFIKKGETSKLKAILFELVTKAEQQYGQGTGELKYAAVADWLYQRIPTILKVLFTPKDISKMIESVLAYAKEKWSTNETMHDMVICEHVPIPHEEIEEGIKEASEEVLNED